jgi:glutamate-ammonia-ligase adenylyltransferase
VSGADEPLARRVQAGGVAPAPPGSGEVLSVTEAHGAAFAGLVAAVAARAPFLRQLLRQDQDRLDRLARRSPESSHRDLVRRQDGLAERAASGEIARDALPRELRRNKAEHALLVALADLGLVWSLEDVVGALTEFADASVRTAAVIGLREAAEAERSSPGLTTGEPGCGLVVLALGKHGAGELNYSSDIDLVIFFDPRAPALSPAAEPSRVYNRVARTMAKLLQERTPDGYVHRVDYRLRPDPASTSAAVSLPAAYVYYETVGQNWERAAMIKARPVAGDLDLGRRVLVDLEPFVWRKYFDFAAIADIHAMKRQIHAVRGFNEIAVAGHDIKLGRGGIREIEFFVQTQQLVFGGRRPALRGRRTLDMLSGLRAEGWVTAEAEAELAAAYRFLRSVEHRLQMVADEQTQRLPTDPAALLNVAGLCGFDTVAAFGEVLTGHARRVQRHYALLFEEGPELAVDAGDLVFTGAAVDPATLTTLERLGFREAANAAETVRGWHFGRRPAVTSARAREVLTELTPSLLAALGGTVDPDGALTRLDRAFGRMPAAVELLTVLRSHPRLRTLFADLLGSAPRLAETVAATPHVLDAVLEPGFAQPEIGDASTEAEFRALLGRPRDTEDFLDRTRDAARQLQFVAGARLLSGILAPTEAGASLAAVARAVLRTSLDWVSAVFEVEHGRVPGGRLAVLGLGRLGAGDLTATSDLDLVALYDFDVADRTSSGPRPLDAVVYYTRLTQRLISALTVATRRGRLYEIDLRLRPSGSKGPIASQFRGFLAYQGEAAELWEHMALTRARVLAGPEDFVEEVRAAILAVVMRKRDAGGVYQGVAAMRDLVSAEKGEGDGWDLKLARGGLLDLDFLAQALTLAHAHDLPELVGLPTPAVLAEAAAAGLVPAASGRALAGAYRLLDDLHHWQRLTLGDRPAESDIPPAVVKRLATLAGLPDAERLKAHLEETRLSVRAVFDAVLR